MRFNLRTIAILASAAPALAGCAAIKLDDLKPGQLGRACVARDVAATASASTPRFVYALPAERSAPPAAALGFETRHPTPRRMAQVSSFTAYSEGIMSSKSSMPTELRNDPVVDAIFRLVIKSSAQAQLTAYQQRAGRLDGQAAAQASAIEAFGVPKKITHRQLEKFARSLFTAGSQPARLEADGVRPLAATTSDQAAAAYFRAYYEGKYVDRYGTKISKPELSATITDAQITAALDVLLDYVIDLADPTPVLGDKPAGSDGGAPDGVKYYPGGFDKAPTSLAAGLAPYRPLDTDCGVTVKTVGLIKDLADAAGDRAAALGGLVAETPGGIEIGLGVLGKVSIGDNKTLSMIAKTAAARIATRATFAAGYWSLADAQPPAS